MATASKWLLVIDLPTQGVPLSRRPKGDLQADEPQSSTVGDNSRMMARLCW